MKAPVLRLGQQTLTGEELEFRSGDNLGEIKLQFERVFESDLQGAVA